MAKGKPYGRGRKGSADKQPKSGRKAMKGSANPPRKWGRESDFGVRMDGVYYLFDDLLKRFGFK